MSKEIIPSPGGSNKFSRLISKIKAALGIVEESNTATHSIAAGKYVTWKGDLYKAKSAISSGATLSSSNLQAVPDGGLNELSEHIVTMGNHVVLTTATETSATDKALAESLDHFRYGSIEAYNNNNALQGSWFFPVAVLQSRSSAASPMSAYFYDGANNHNVYILFKSNTVLNCMVSSGFKFIVRGIR